MPRISAAAQSAGEAIPGKSAIIERAKIPTTAKNRQHSRIQQTAKESFHMGELLYETRRRIEK
jgi:hypothetical protein